jgi:hypothetical protein
MSAQGRDPSVELALDQRLIADTRNRLSVRLRVHYDDARDYVRVAEHVVPRTRYAGLI